MINVLYISHESRDVFGSTLSLANMLNSLKKEVKPTIVLSQKGKAYDYLKGQGFPCIVVPFKLNISPIKFGILKYVPRKIVNYCVNSMGIKRLCKIVEEEDIQLVHSNSGVVTIGYMLAKRCGLKHVWHLREFQDLDFGFTPFTGWKKLLAMIHDSDAVIAITNAVAEHFGISRRPGCHVVYNAVGKSEDICFAAKKSETILFCGHVIPNKGAEKALDIFTGFHKEHPRYKLYYLGAVDDGYKSHLKQKAGENGIADAVEFLGYRNDVKTYVKKASALLMCSENEALGRVTVEAMFYGCPILGYSSGGTKELISDGYNGFLFSSIDEAIAKLSMVVSNDNKKIIDNAHDFVKNNFTEEVYGEKILSIYKSLL